MDKSIEKLKEDVARLEETIKNLMLVANAGLGIDINRLYTKKQFLAALGYGPDAWRSINPKIVLGDTNNPKILGADYYRDLIDNPKRKRKGRNDDAENEGEDRET